MKKLILGVAAMLMALVCVAPAAAQTLTIDQKIKLSVSARDANGAPVTIPGGTIVVWAVEGGTTMGNFLTTGIATGELAVYYSPVKPGVHNVTASLTIENGTFNAKIALTVTSVIPASIVITAGLPIPK